MIGGENLFNERKIIIEDLKKIDLEFDKKYPLITKKVVDIMIANRSTHIVGFSFSGNNNIKLAFKGGFNLIILKGKEKKEASKLKADSANKLNNNTEFNNAGKGIEDSEIEDIKLFLEQSLNFKFEINVSKTKKRIIFTVSNDKIGNIKYDIPKKNANSISSISKNILKNIKENIREAIIIKNNESYNNTQKDYMETVLDDFIFRLNEISKGNKIANIPVYFSRNKKDIVIKNENDEIFAKFIDMDFNIINYLQDLYYIKIVDRDSSGLIKHEAFKIEKYNKKLEDVIELFLKRNNLVNIEIYNKINEIHSYYKEHLDKIINIDINSKVINTKKLIKNKNNTTLRATMHNFELSSINEFNLTDGEFSVYSVFKGEKFKHRYVLEKMPEIESYKKTKYFSFIKFVYEFSENNNINILPSEKGFLIDGKLKFIIAGEHFSIKLDKEILKNNTLFQNKTYFLSNIKPILINIENKIKKIEQKYIIYFDNDLYYDIINLIFKNNDYITESVIIKYLRGLKLDIKLNETDARGKYNLLKDDFIKMAIGNLTGPILFLIKVKGTYCNYYKIRVLPDVGIIFNRYNKHNNIRKLNKKQCLEFISANYTNHKQIRFAIKGLYNYQLSTKDKLIILSIIKDPVILINNYNELIELCVLNNKDNEIFIEMIKMQREMEDDKVIKKFYKELIVKLENGENI